MWYRMVIPAIPGIEGDEPLVFDFTDSREASIQATHAFIGWLGICPSCDHEEHLDLWLACRPVISTNDSAWAKGVEAAFEAVFKLAVGERFARISARITEQTEEATKGMERRTIHGVEFLLLPMEGAAVSEAEQILAQQQYPEPPPHR